MPGGACEHIGDELGNVGHIAQRFTDGLQRLLEVEDQFVGDEEQDEQRLEIEQNLLEDEEKEIDGYTFKSVFKYDYEKMRKNFEDFEEDLLKAVLHPRRIMRNLELYGYDLDDMFD